MFGKGRLEPFSRAWLAVANGWWTILRSRRVGPARARSFDDLIRFRYYRRRYRQAKGVRRLGLLDGYAGRVLAFEDFVDIPRPAAEQIREIGAKEIRPPASTNSR
jgi:hypothetical protein